MLRQLSLFLLILCLSSCQQRYRHVKKVKADKNKSVQKEDSGPENKPNTLVITPADTLPELSNIPSEIAPEEPKTKAETPKTKPRSFADKLDETKKLFPSRIFNDLIPDRSQSKSNDEPLTTEEKILIVCIFLVWFMIMMFLLIMPVLITLLVFLFMGLFVSGAILSTGALATLAILSVLMFVLVFVLSYRVGRNRINKKLGRELGWSDLFKYFLLALAVLVIGGAIAGLFPPLSIGFQIASAIPVLVILFALVYIFIWDF